MVAAPEAQPLPLVHTSNSCHPSLPNLQTPPPPTLQVQYGDMGLLYEVLVEVRGILEAGLAAADTVRKRRGLRVARGSGGLEK